MKSILLPLLAAGCVANDLNLTIDKYVPLLVANDCKVSPSQSEAVAEAFLDVGLVGITGRGYLAFPVVTNHLQPSTTAQGTVERHSILFKGANVELEPDGALSGAVPLSQRKFFASAAGVRIDPGGAVATGLEVIPSQLASALAGAGVSGVITAKLSPVGDYSGDTIVGGAVPLPIRVCSFCLSGMPTACPPGGFPPDQVQSGCIPSQDVNVTCCVDSQNRLLCGDQVPVMTM